MRSRVAAVAVLAVLSGPTVSHADSIARIGPPKELPPASFAGPQYVDSRGCVYMRAGYDGAVKWVPRLGDSHEPLCGYQPTMAAAPAPVAVAAAPMPAEAPARMPAPVAAPAVAPAGAGAPPPGYAWVWQDGRLNPLRGRGTAEGETAMYRVWTNTVPMRGLPTPATDVLPAAYVAPPPGGTTRLSTMNDPAALPAPRQAAPTRAAGAFVQVGSFSVAANAAGAAARLRALGLPVTVAPGAALQAVLAGPFADPAAAQAALRAVRGAGFADAYLRG
jgi:hypothetical protein